MQCTRLSHDAAEALYRKVLAADFPPDELRPAAWVAELLARGQYFGFLFTDGETPVGYTFLCRADNQELYLVDYFAVFAPFRGKGFGSAMLEALRTEFSAAEALFFEVDDPDFAVADTEKNKRDRRLAFYFRGGLADTEVRTCVWGCEFRILSLDQTAAFRGQDAAEGLNAIYKILFPNEFYVAHVEFHPPFCPQQNN